MVSGFSAGAEPVVAAAAAAAPTAAYSAGLSGTSSNGVAGYNETAAWTGNTGKLSSRPTHGAVCVMSASAMAYTGQVTKSRSGNNGSSCSSDVLRQMKRTNRMSVASMVRFCFWTARSRTRVQTGTTARTARLRLRSRLR
ncbi:hypothetical protein PC128_g23133 [Phytophthora cactorum]|nr:hypothetical protein PC128_g23133 [Phytophthora cactorum]